MVRLIASDLDDTLLNREAQLSAENIQAIREVQAKGITFTIATGRMFQSALPFAKELGLPAEQPMICYNGALIKRLSGETIYERFLDPELALKVARYGQERGWTVNLYYQDELYVAEINEQVQSYAENAQVDVFVVGDLAQFIVDGQKRLEKILIVSEVDEVPGRIGELESLVGGEVQIVRSRQKYIEITDVEAHKGAALMWLAKFLGFSPNEVMAIGDSNNDITMLQMAGLGVAVENALPAVKAAANYLTSSHSEHGVAKAIFDHVLKK